MRVFVTGATGFIGSAIVQELISAGHQVLGLVRSEEAARLLTGAGAAAHRGNLEDLDSLRRGAAATDGVIHTAFIHDFSNMASAGKTDRAAIGAIGAELAGSDRPFVVTSGLALVAPGSLATEDMASDPSSPGGHRVPSEEDALALASEGVRSSLIRLPPSVHGQGDHGFVPVLIGIAREKGVSAYVGNGLNRWPALHRLDAARLYRLALEKGSAGIRYHGVGEEGVPMREIAEAIGRHLNLPVVSKPPEEAAGHFGWIARFAAVDCPASGDRTKEELGWHPTQPGLIADLNRGHYFG